MFLNKFFTDEIDELIDHSKIAIQLQEYEKRNKQITEKFSVHFDIFNEIIGSLKEITKPQETNRLLEQVADKLGISLTKLSARIRFNRTYTDTKTLHRASAADIEDVSSTARIKDDANAKKGQQELEDLVETMIKGKFAGVNVKSMPCAVPINEDCFAESTESTAERIGYKQRLLKKHTEILALYTSTYQNYTKKQFQKEYKQRTKTGRYEDVSAIAAIMRAIELTSGYSLRDVQILAIQEFFAQDTNKFCQIGTGEGKTVITSALAVIRALQGHTVDIITSNSVLAEAAVLDRRQFYALFGLSVTHNNPDSTKAYVEGLKPCYAYDIVYGTLGTFAFDYMHNNVEALGTKVVGMRDGCPIARECDTVIVDEVDNVILDNYALFTNQSNSVAGIDQVKFIYIDIWQRLHNADQDLNVDQSNVTDEIRKVIRNTIDVKEIERNVADDIPHCFRRYICAKLQLLVDNAIKAKYDLHEDEDYVIGVRDMEDNVVPLEKEIGVRLQDFIWTDLHPFLQMKHNLHVNSCETLTSVFIPNCVYLRLYTRIYGLTGTLGSLKERQFIYKIYEADSTVIPASTPSQLTDDGRRMVDDETQWLNVLSAVASKYHSRAVLFVCETPKTLHKIQRYLLTNGFTNIVTYENESDAHKIAALNDSDGAQVGTIICATNIGGRGTDIKLSDRVASYGGLHECTTYLPKNIRTERQAAGRAARAGQSGSTEILFQRKEFEELKNAVPDCERAPGETEIAYAVRLRDSIEEARLENASAHVQAILRNYRTFTKFENHYYFLKLYLKLNHFILEDLKLKFGLCFDKADNDELEAFFERIELDLRDSFAGYEFLNPNLCIKYAQSFLRAGEIDQAQQILSARQSKELCSLPAYYLTMFEIELTHDHSIFMRLLDPIFGLFPANDSNDGAANRLAIKHLTDAKERLQHRADAISELIDSDDFRNICLSKAEHNYGENMMLAHLESEQTAIITTLIHVGKLRDLIKQKSIDNKRIYVKRTYRFEEIMQNALDVDLPVSGISSSELQLADKVGLGIFYELGILEQINISNPTVLKANVKIASAITMLSSAVIPQVGLIIGPALSIPASKLLRSGIKQILSVVFNDPEIYTEVEDAGEYLLDVISSFGGPATTLPRILRAVLIEIGQCMLAKLVIRQFGSQISGCIRNIIQPIMKLIRPVLTKIHEFKEYIYNKLKYCILDPIKAAIQQMIDKAKQIFSENDTAASLDMELTIIPLVKDASNDFQTIINEIVGFKCTILRFWEDGFDIFKQFRSVASEFPTLGGSAIKKIIDFVKLIENFINGALSDSIKTLAKKIANLVSGIIELISQCIQFIKNKVNIIISKIKRIINEILANPRKFLAELCTFIQISFIQELHKKLSALSSAFVQIVNEIFDMILRNNPIDIYLAKHRIDLSKPDTVVEKFCSIAVDQILRCIMTLIIQPKRQVADVDNVEAIVAVNRSCIPDALTRLLQLENLDELLCVTRAYISKHVIENNGLTRWETRFILEDLGLKVIEPSTNGHHSETALNSLDHYRSIGGVGLFVRREGTGHAYCINKDGQRVRFVDNDHANGECSDRLAEYSKWYLLIPMNFSERQKRQIRERIRKNPHPNDAFSFVYIIRQLWEEFYESQTFGASKYDCKDLREYPCGKIKIKADQDLLKVLKHVSKRLSKAQTAEADLNKDRPSLYAYQSQRETVAAFGDKPGKKEMMMGALSVKFNDESEFKRIAVSGKEDFYTRVRITFYEEPAKPQDICVKGYQLVHSDLTSKPGVHIYDITTRTTLAEKYNQNCAAQKLIYALCKHIKDCIKGKPNFAIVGAIKMAEGWYDQKDNKIVMQRSCTNCEIVLPLVTGKY